MNFSNYYVEPVKRYWNVPETFFSDEYNLVRAVTHKSYHIGMHAHAFYELNIVLAGAGVHHMENGSVSVKKGDVFVVPPDSYHGYERQGSGLDVFHLIFKKEFLKIYFKDLEKIAGFSFMFDAEPHLRQQREGKYYLHLNDAELADMMRDINLLLEADEKKLFVYQNIIALKYVCDLCIISNRKQKKKAEELNGKDIVMLIQYIQNNLSEKITVKDIAAKANMSHSTVTRFFRKTTGLSPMQYVIFLRKQRASSLINETDLRKSEIAQICGFYDLSHMEKALK
ncbi:MAG: helix-turn-helix domain-containing protein [Clostridia bacterium]|nr:helix-turn-helix domain-containing protein [Clostridia bacterium]